MTKRRAITKASDHQGKRAVCIACRTMRKAQEKKIKKRKREEVLRIVSQEAVVIKRKEREKKRKKARNYVEKQTPGVHTQYPGTSGNKGG